MTFPELYQTMHRAEKAHELEKDLYEMFPDAEDLTVEQAKAVGCVRSMLMTIEREERETLNNANILRN